MTGEYQVRRASLADFAAVLAIERACADTAHWTEAAWRGILQQADTSETARAVFVCNTQDDLSGFIVVHRVQESAELESVAVRPEHRRRGVARALCRHAIGWASAQTAGGPQCAAMRLEVRAGNAAALQFYTALGFINQGRRRAYYRNPVEDAVLMELPLDGPRDDGEPASTTQTVRFPELGAKV